MELENLGYSRLRAEFEEKAWERSFFRNSVIAGAVGIVTVAVAVAIALFR